MDVRLGVPTRRGIVNVDATEADEADKRDAVSIIVNRFDAAEKAEAHEIAQALKERLDFAGKVQERAYDDGNPYILVKRRAERTASELKSALGL